MASLSSLIIMSILCSALAAQDFQSVSACPRDGVNWKSESVKKNCQGDTPDYLCAAIENQPNKYGQICTKYGLTPANKCAVLNEQTYNLDSVDCKADSGCPTDPYIPSELWRYQICYGDFYGTTTMATASTTQKTINETTGSASRSGDSGSGAGLKAGVVVAVVILSIILIIVVVIGILLAYRKNLCGFKDKVDKRITVTDIRTHFPCFQQSTDTEGLKDVKTGDPTPEQTKPLIKQEPVYAKHDKDKTKKDFEKGQPSEQAQPLIQQEPVYAKPDKDKTKKGKHDKTKQNTEKLKELLMYPAYILKQELSVSDVKEKVVIHSKSINEHFSEPLIKGLQNIKDHNDYGQLDMSLVFALLRNFCDGIKPPSRGWDYEPPDDEIHVGADIERIRSMWNKFCDKDLQFKHLDDVYNRMKQKYGTLAVCRDDSSKVENNPEGFEEVMEKIQSIKLNPDCTVKKGIVTTGNITTALKILESRNVVILKGVIGCGKTHALKAIQNHFQALNKETAWVEPENMLEEISNKKSTILLCDNLFGKFGSSVFSQDAVINTENVLKEIDSSKSETKVVIGIHTHVFDEVKINGKLTFLLQKNITVEMDNLSEAETLLIYKKQLAKGHCKMDPNCWFKNVGFQSVLDKLSKNQGHIGGPFLSLMYCNQHELFSDEAFSTKPLQTLMQYMERMKNDSPKLYHCLVYLMCVQQHNCEEEPEKWAGHINVEITKDNFMDFAKKSGLLQVENKRTTLAHELLTTVLFKSAFKSEVIIFPVLQMCKSDVFLQLLRPTDSTHSDVYIKYMYDSRSDFSKDVGKMCAYRLAQEYKKPEIVHPLMTEEFVKSKCFEYLYREPKHVSLLKGLK